MNGGPSKPSFESGAVPSGSGPAPQPDQRMKSDMVEEGQVSVISFVHFTAWSLLFAYDPVSALAPLGFARGLLGLWYYTGLHRPQ